MKIQNLIVYGISKADTSFKIEPETFEPEEQNWANTQRPEELTGEKVYELFLSLLYPDLYNERMVEIFNSFNAQTTAKVVMHFLDQGHQFRSTGHASGDLYIEALNTQNKDNQWIQKAKGVQEVTAFYKTTSTRPIQDVFEGLALWQTPDLFVETPIEPEQLEWSTTIPTESIVALYKEAVDYAKLTSDLQQDAILLVRKKGFDDNQNVSSSNAIRKFEMEHEIKAIEANIAELRLGSLTANDLQKAFGFQQAVKNTSMALDTLSESQLQLEARMFRIKSLVWLQNYRYWILLGLFSLIIFSAPFLPVQFSYMLFVCVIICVYAGYSLRQDTYHLGDISNFLIKYIDVNQKLEHQFIDNIHASQSLRHFQLASGHTNLNQTKNRFQQRETLSNTLEKKRKNLTHFLDEVKDNLSQEPVSIGLARWAHHTYNDLSKSLKQSRQHLLSLPKPPYPIKTLEAVLTQRGEPLIKVECEFYKASPLEKREYFLIAMLKGWGLIKDSKLAPELETIWHQLLHSFMRKNLYFCISNEKIVINKQKSTIQVTTDWRLSAANVYRWVLFALNCAIIEYTLERNLPHRICDIVFLPLSSNPKHQVAEPQLQALMKGTKHVQWILL